jgi:hypothetical protein
MGTEAGGVAEDEGTLQGTWNDTDSTPFSLAA